MLDNVRLSYVMSDYVLCWVRLCKVWLEIRLGYVSLVRGLV